MGGGQATKPKVEEHQYATDDIIKPQTIIESKIVLLGDSGVGKSSIAQRFCRNSFTEAYDVTIGGAYM